MKAVKQTTKLTVRLHETSTIENAIKMILIAPLWSQETTQCLPAQLKTVELPALV